MRRAALAGLLLLGACAQAPVVGRADAEAGGGARPTLVSLNPCSDAVLAEVAHADQLLAISHYSRDPASSSIGVAAARRFRAVSGSVEEIAALAPDVVVAASFLPAPSAAALEDLGIRVVRLPIATSIAESKEQVLTLARLAGRPQRGRALVARIGRALAEAAPPPGWQPPSTLVWQSGGIVPGNRTLIADLLRQTGFSSFSAARGLGQAEYLPLERVIADPPDLILAAGDARSNENRLLGHPALAGLRRTRRERLDPALLWCGGPTIIRAAARLKAIRETTRPGAPS